MMYSEIYNNLITYTLPFAIKNSSLDEQEVLDYIHDFYIDLQDNQVRWEDGVKKGTYDLEKLTSCSLGKKNLSKFFFQYVTRAKYMEGRWIDRRVLGRRTQAETQFGAVAPHHIPPPMSYEMHLTGDCEIFIQSISEDEKIVLNHRVCGDSMCEFVGANKSMSQKKYYKVLNSLQTKAKEFLV